jgi:tetratricopeptide (TPR) repeat protein
MRGRRNSRRLAVVRDTGGWLLALAACGAIALATVLPAQAVQIDYDPRRPQQLRPCDEHAQHGRADEARECYAKLNDTEPVDTLLRAEVAWSEDDPRSANEYFMNAQDGPLGSYARVRRARLFLETHQYSDAIELLQEAAKLAPDDREVKLALAQLFADQYESQATQLLDEVLKDEPNMLGALLLSARMSIDEGKAEEAEKLLERAQRGVEQRKLAPLEVYTLRAALDLARGEAVRGPWVDRALAWNPHYGAIFAELGRVEVMRRRYIEANVYLLRAVEVQPELWSAQAELGANLLRLGRTEEARQHLMLAYSGDPFSPSTVNTLRLLDRSGDFELVNLPDLRLQLARKESAVLQPYATLLARQALESFSTRYKFRPAQPITIEIYPDHDDFAVRTAGLPGIGLLGVTFGYLLAMDSPSGRQAGEFHWGSTLWHELAHVFTLSMTGHRVPRWLSEGVSVFEEWRTGPTPGVSVPPSTLQAFSDGKFLPIEHLDAGFIRPEYPNQVQVSYMQAGLTCYFIEQRFGFDKLVALLNAFQSRNTTAAAVQSSLGIAPKQFDRQFEAFVRERYAPLLGAPKELGSSMRAGYEALEKQQWNVAIDNARRAVHLFPEHVGPDSPHLLLAHALDRSGQRPAALEALLAYRKAGGWHPAALRELAQWLIDVKRDDEATEVLAAVNYVDPFEVSGHALLGERLLARKRDADALREFQVLGALGPLDKTAASLGLARALHGTGDVAASRRAVLDALESAPHYAPAQEFLLRLVEEREKK